MSRLISYSMADTNYLCLAESSLVTPIMEPGKKKPYIIRNIEWIGLIILILAGLIAVWRIYYPGIFSNG